MPDRPVKPKTPHKPDQLMQRVVTLLLLGAGLFVLLSRSYDENTARWAASTIAFVSGYWLRGAK